eukprot:465267-Amphidinium_carterae.1
MSRLCYANYMFGVLRRIRWVAVVSCMQAATTSPVEKVVKLLTELKERIGVTEAQERWAYKLLLLLEQSYEQHPIFIISNRLQTSFWLSVQEQQIYEKYACWCEKTTARKAKNIEDAEVVLEKTGQAILKYKAQVALGHALIAVRLQPFWESRILDCLFIGVQNLLIVHHICLMLLPVSCATSHRLCCHE